MRGRSNPAAGARFGRRRIAGMSDTASPPAIVTGDALRRAMRRLPSPVVVITARAGGDVRGATIGSFVSVSLAPPLVTWNVTHGTRFEELAARASRFAVHLLGTGNARYARRFADPELDDAAQFAGLDAAGLASDDAPELPGTLGVLRCEPVARHPAGDSTLVVARVTGWAAGEEGAPLVYFDRHYRGLGDAL